MSTTQTATAPVAQKKKSLRQSMWWWPLIIGGSILETFLPSQWYATEQGRQRIS